MNISEKLVNKVISSLVIGRFNIFQFENIFHNINFSTSGIKS